jgi:hypothetical protein
MIAYSPARNGIVAFGKGKARTLLGQLKKTSCLSHNVSVENGCTTFHAELKPPTIGVVNSNRRKPPTKKDIKITPSFTSSRILQDIK